MVLVKELAKKTNIPGCMLKISKSDATYLNSPHFSFTNLLKTKFNVVPTFNSDSNGTYCQLTGENGPNALTFVKRLLKIEEVDIKKYPLPIELQDWAKYSMSKNHNVKFDEISYRIKGRLKEDLIDSVTFVKRAYHWSKIQHFDVLRNCGHLAVPFYPSYDPSESFSFSKKPLNTVADVFNNYLIPPGYVGYRLFPSNIKMPLTLASRSNRQYLVNEKSNFKLFVDNSFEDFIHLQMGVYTWKVETGYAIHLHKNDKMNFEVFPEDIPLSSPSELRSLSNLTIFQSFKTLEDNSEENSSIKAFFYISSSKNDFRITMYDSKKPSTTDLMTYLSAIELLQ